MQCSELLASRIEVGLDVIRVLRSGRELSAEFRSELLRVRDLLLERGHLRKPLSDFGHLSLERYLQTHARLIKYELSVRRGEDFKTYVKFRSLLTKVGSEGSELAILRFKCDIERRFLLASESESLPQIRNRRLELSSTRGLLGSIRPKSSAIVIRSSQC